jgi:hypothetical protein
MQDEGRRRWKQGQQQDSSKGIRKAAARCVCPQGSWRAVTLYEWSPRAVMPPPSRPQLGGMAWGWTGVRSIGELARLRTSRELWSDRQIGRHRLTLLPDAVPNAGRGAGDSVTCPPSSSLPRESAGFDEDLVVCPRSLAVQGAIYMESACHWDSGTCCWQGAWPCEGKGCLPLSGMTE